MIAIAAFVGHMAIPHHEHGETVCFEQIDCSAGEEAAKDGHACCLDQQEIIRSQDDRHAADCIHSADCEIHFPPIFLFVGDFFELSKKPVNVNKPYLNFYTSADILSVNTLRGPPQI